MAENLVPLQPAPIVGIMAIAREEGTASAIRVIMSKSMSYRFFLPILVMFVLMDMTMCGVAAYTFRRSKSGKFFRRLAEHLLGLFAETWAILFATSFGYIQPPKYTVGFIICFWIGRILRFAGTLRLLLHTFDVQDKS